MKPTYDRTIPRKYVNVSINADLLKQAKALNINLSRTLEERLSELVREQPRQLWPQENSEAIEAYNQRVSQNNHKGDRSIFHLNQRENLSTNMKN